MTGVDLSGAPKLSPFHDYWASRNASASWSAHRHLALPMDLGDSVAETAAFAVAAAFADISHRTMWNVEGDDAIPFISSLCGEDQEKFHAGRSCSVLWSDAIGHVRGAGKAAILGESSVRFSTLTSDAAWIAQAAETFDVRIHAPQMAGLRLAGPASAAALEAAGAEPESGCFVIIPGLGPVLAIPVAEGAVDLWCQPDEAMALAWTLERAGARPAGQNAANVWRVANGLLQPGLDWCPAAIATSPAQFRRREHLTAGAYLLASWDEAPPQTVKGAVFWPAAAHFRALIWAPVEAGRAQMPPAGGVILGPAATD